MKKSNNIKIGNEGGFQKSTNFILEQWFTINENKVKDGLWWDFMPGDVFDLDGAVNEFDECNEPIEIVYYHNLKVLNGTEKNSRDNLTGKVSGDDKVITIEFNKIPPGVYSLAVTLNSYGNKSIIKAKSAFIRLIRGKNKKEMGGGRFL